MDIDRFRDNTIILLDTNSLFFPFLLDMDVEEKLKDLVGKNFKILLPSTVVSELNNLVCNREKFSAAALEYSGRFEVIESPGKGDDSILALAGKLNAIVVTGDRKLRRRLNEAGLCVICPRGKNRLMFYGCSDV